VQGITFLRNCGNGSIGALRIAGGSGSTILVQNCQFLSPANTSGMGIEIASGLNATISNSTAAGAASGGLGTGISIAGITGNVSVQQCTVTTNSSSGASVSGAASIAFTGNTFNGNSGWGVSCSGTSVTVSNNTFIGNSGGGFSFGSGTVTLSGNAFIGNSGNFGFYCDAYQASAAATFLGNTFNGNSVGGALLYASYNGGATGVFVGNTFISNSGSGGACCYCTGTLTLSNNLFTGNGMSTGGWGSGGGGAYCCSKYGNSAVVLSGNTFSGNSAASCPGGGAYCYGVVTLVGNTFKQNTASQSGGGLYASGSTVTLQDNLIVKNSQSGAGYQGGGIWVNPTATLNMINNTVFGNTANGSGGGAAFQVYSTVELLNVYNNIIWGNSATGNGADVWLAGTGQKKVFLFNDVNSMYGVWDIAQNLLNVDPKFFDAVNGDYHIQSTSPCKDAGTNGAPSLPATDLDGGPRIANGTVDLGCYEFSTAATHPADINADFVITSDEFNAYAAAWKAGQTWTNAPSSAPNPNPIPADYLTRAGYLMTNGGTYHNDGSARPVNWKIGP
jgi:predicted outer membrane repeat protein